VSVVTTASSVVNHAASTTPSTSATTFWKPAAGITWQIELINTVSDTDFNADVFDLDVFDNSAATISTLHAKGRKVICYFSAGTYEDWRSDAALFQTSDKGKAMVDWPGESWLDTNSANVRSIMTKRIDLAKSKGCDGVDPDNVDGYNNDNGLGLTTDDAINYLKFLSGVAHDRGLSIGLKNGGEIVKDILPYMEFQVNEQCMNYNECTTFSPFIDAGKPVFHIEYPDGAPNLSASQKTTSCASPSGFSTILKTLDLDEWIYTC
jgi:hypothetical protein